MAVASSTAALLGAAVTLASTAVGTWSAVSRQEEQRKQAEFSADMARRNAQIAESVFGNSFINNETFQQYACHGYLSHGLRHIKASLVIPHKTPPANQPAECSFNYPTLRHWLKACLPWCAFHDFHNKSKIGGLVHQ